MKIRIKHLKNIFENLPEQSVKYLNALPIYALVQKEYDDLKQYDIQDSDILLREKHYKIGFTVEQTSCGLEWVVNI